MKKFETDFYMLPNQEVRHVFNKHIHDRPIVDANSFSSLTPFTEVNISAFLQAPGHARLKMARQIFSDISPKGSQHVYSTLS
jgi:hypothetical protein